eukprot:m.42352 g.42352  ORF g.42352 m.42352 type:complete len:199 (+) comp9872_c0_seq2:230-826(+)
MGILYYGSFCWAILRIGCYSVGKKIGIFKDHVPKPQYDILCLGIDGAGKSSILAVACQEPLEEVQPTDGFSIKAVQLSGMVFNVKEVAGSQKYRKYWHRYYSGCQGLVFVIDSASTQEKFQESLSCLNDVLQDSSWDQTPVLILVNKSDLSSFRPKTEILEAINSSVIAMETTIQDRETVISAFDALSSAYESTDDIA